MSMIRLTEPQSMGELAMITSLLEGSGIPYMVQNEHVSSLYPGLPILNSSVMVGMSKEQVLEAWGGPQTINTTFTKEGIRREEWIFEDWESAAVVKHRYLYFEEGSLIGGWFQGSGERLPTQAPSNPHAQKPQR